MTVAATVGGIERPGRLGDRERAGELARGDRAEEARLLLRRAGLAHRGHELRDGREQRPGRDHPAELLGEDRQLEHAEADAAVRLRGWSARASRARPSSPRARRDGAVGLDDAPGERDRALLGEHRADRVAELVLIGA